MKVRIFHFAPGEFGLCSKISDCDSEESDANSENRPNSFILHFCYKYEL